VVGVDGSTPSKAALRFAQRLALATGASLDVIGGWAWPNAIAMADVALDYSPRDDIEKELTRSVDEVFGADRGTDVTVRAVQGDPARVLIDESRGALMLVVGSRGLGGFRSLLLGSVSARVAAHATCPVLIVHATQEETS
jgi:nucleotide-binding universal stress UspA family protein